MVVLAIPGVITTTLVRATSVFGWQAATVIFGLRAINSFVVAIACFATHRLTHIIEHSGHTGTKGEF